MNLKKLSILSVLVLCLVFTRLPAQECTIQEEERTIKTYPFSDPNPIPILVRRPTLYPYFSFNGYTSEGLDRTWNVVRLENDYIRAFILPAAGGKIYGAVEKSTNQDFIYMNDVMKFRQIALRGPWTSGGSEFNFGIVGHTPATATPVDYLLMQNPDGGVSCVVGNMDLPSRTRWSITITVPKDRAYLETRVLYYNPTPFHQSYYVWMNNAVKASKDLKFDYPGDFWIPHGYDFQPNPWPMDDAGRDLSWYRNNDFGRDKSYFVLGEYENFFGGYWQDRAFGFGHWALYDDVPGKKMWIWALSRQGAIWEALLTDTAGQYSEPQSGRLFSQSDHEFFAPYTGDTWREILFPFKEIGGLVKASPHGALNVKREGRSVTIGLCPLQALNDELVVALGDEEVLREQIGLAPMEVYRKSLELPSEEGTLRVEVSNKIAFSDDPLQNDIHRPIRFHTFGEQTAESLFLSGAFHEKRRQYDDAMKKYRACLQREPLHMRALTRAAELHGRMGKAEIGLEYARRALDQVMYDPDANYIYGVLSRRMGHLVDAKETLGWAARSMKYRSGAYCQMAEIHIIEKNFDLALEYGSRALDFNRYNLRAYEILAIAHRMNGNPTKARTVLEDLARIDPLNHLARFEAYLLEPSPEKLEAFRGLIRNELPHAHYLEMAISYVDLGRVEDAATLLEKAPTDTLATYWLAYLKRASAPEESKILLAKAGRLSPNLVFPFRLESIPVFQWAMMACPDDWKPRYYLGLILWGKGRIEEARMLFDGCTNVDFAPFYLVQGHLDRKQARTYLEKALAVDDRDWRTWYHLARHLQESGQNEEALAHSKKATEKFPDRIELSMEYAGALFKNQRMEQCLAVIDGLTVLPYEGGWEARHLFMSAHVHLAMEAIGAGTHDTAISHLQSARTYPEHLGTGKPYDPDFRMQDALEAVCLEKKGERKEAGERWKRIKEFTFRKGLGTGMNDYFCLIALEQLKEYDQADKFLKGLEARFPDQPRVAWCRARYDGDDDRIAAIEDELHLDPRFLIEMEVAQFIDRITGNR